MKNNYGYYTIYSMICYCILILTASSLPNMMYARLRRRHNRCQSRPVRCCPPRPRARCGFGGTGFGFYPPNMPYGYYGPYYPPFNAMFFGPPIAPYPYYSRPGVAFAFGVGL